MLSKSAIRAKRREDHYKKCGVSQLDRDAQREGTAIWRACKDGRPGGGRATSILWNKNVRRFWIRADIENGTQDARLIKSFRIFCRLYLRSPRM